MLTQAASSSDVVVHAEEEKRNCLVAARKQWPENSAPGLGVDDDPRCLEKLRLSLTRPPHDFGELTGWGTVASSGNARDSDLFVRFPQFKGALESGCQ